MAGSVSPLMKPIVRTQMLIRKPLAEVFDAFVDPAITTRFWFTRSSGGLETGKRVTWEWEMYGVSASVLARAVETNSRILIEWGDPSSTVEWQFSAHGPDCTLVEISHRGFHGSDTEAVNAAIDSMGGFSLVLAGLKALLEHGVELNLVADRNPDGHVAGSGPAR